MREKQPLKKKTFPGMIIILNDTAFEALTSAHSAFDVSYKPHYL